MKYSVSVIVRTHNRSSLLQKTLQSLIQQSYPSNLWETVIVDNASSDNTKEIIFGVKNNLTNFNYIFEPKLGAAIARRTGMKAAKGEIIAWIDDDCVAEPNWLEELVEAFDVSDHRPVIVGGEIQLKWENGRPMWMPEELEHALGRLWFEDAPCVVNAVNGANMAWRRDVIDVIDQPNIRLGPVGRNKSRTSEDSDICGRIRQRGETIWFTPKATVHHYVPSEHSTVAYLLNRYFTFGVSDSIRYQTGYPGDRVDSIKRSSKTFLLLLRDLLNLFLYFPMRLITKPSEILVDLAPIVTRTGFLTEEVRFQIRSLLG